MGWIQRLQPGAWNWWRRVGAVCGQRNAPQHGRSPQRYRPRWAMGPTVARLRHFRRLCIRWEKSSRAFDAYLQMTLAFLPVRQVPG
ncbi:hypothetical protein [Limisphaera sp. 4302-co]|uniref:hypothetical protein n=1 Tax=Limisphaera sp. 4302-co TaxID=3400417 RepID=UPI003C26D3B5